MNVIHPFFSTIPASGCSVQIVFTSCGLSSQLVDRTDRLAAGQPTWPANHSASLLGQPVCQSVNQLDGRGRQRQQDGARGGERLGPTRSPITACHQRTSTSAFAPIKVATICRQEEPAFGGGLFFGLLPIHPSVRPVIQSPGRSLDRTVTR